MTTTPNLTMLTAPRSAAAEAYRTLRTNLIFSSVEKPITTLLVTSPAQSEDKSAVIANLAIAFAQAGNQTILIDADLRRPAQPALWGVNAERGLTSMILEDGALAAPPLLDTGVPNLKLLPTGPLPPIPADVLSSQRMAEVIGVLKARATYLLFDAPPVLAATDAALLGAKLDGVLLAVRTGSTRRDQLGRARDELTRVHVRLLGAVMTNAPTSKSDVYR
jgi:non-specific protein-tyrosine kinase